MRFSQIAKIGATLALALGPTALLAQSGVGGGGLSGGSALDYPPPAAAPAQPSLPQPALGQPSTAQGALAQPSSAPGAAAPSQPAAPPGPASIPATPGVISISPPDELTAPSGRAVAPQYEDLGLNPEPAKLRVDPRTEEESEKLRFLSLYIGVPIEQSVPNLPRGFSVKGDFRKFVNVSVSRATRTLKFEAKKEGVGTLTIQNARGQKIYEFRIDSRQSDLTKVARELRALLTDIEGIAIKIVNNRVVVDGQVLLPREIERIHSVVKQYNGRADSLVRLSPLAQKKIAALIQNQINNPEIQVSTVNDKFMLEGWAANRDEKDRAEIIAKLYVPDIVKTTGEADGLVVPLRKDFVINLIQVRPDAPPEPGKPIQLVVHYVELNKNYTNAFRFDFSPALNDGSTVTFTNDSQTPGGVASTITGTINSLLPKLNWAKTHGNARILQSTSLTVLNKQKGDIKSVLNIPYQVTNAQGQPSTNFADAGMISTITPEILNPRSDNIRLTMEFSMANLVGLTAQGPMISKNQMQTVVIVRSGQSAAVGGLISNQTSTDYNKLPPGASTNPIISLYASKAFQRNQSQFVVFVTPIIKSSASAGAEKIKKKMRLRD
jgi:pilus assembly protein CpaC